MKKLLLLILPLLLFACSRDKQRQQVNISFADSVSIKLSGLDTTIMNLIDRDTVTNRWQNLFPVYRMPADADLKEYQPVQPGLYTIEKDEVLFIPDTPFVKGQTYFVRFYRFDEGAGLWDIIGFKNKPGSHTYTDLIFKP